MTAEDPIEARDELVYVIDLTTGEIDRAATLAASDGSGVIEPPPLPQAPPEPIRSVALLLDHWVEPLLLPIEPTRDVALLDAIARLLRIAVLAGERVPNVAVEYGEQLERSLAFERRLPGWVYDGVDRELAEQLPAEIQRVLGPRDRR